MFIDLEPKVIYCWKKFSWDIMVRELYHISFVLGKKYFVRSLIDWLKKHIKPSRVILCFQVTEMWIIYVHIYIFVVVFCTLLYDIKYSYQIQIICTLLYDIKYSYLIQIICTLLYDIKYSYLIQIICTLLYDIKYSYLIQIICTQLYDIKYSYLIQIIGTQVN